MTEGQHKETQEKGRTDERKTDIKKSTQKERITERKTFRHNEGTK